MIRPEGVIVPIATPLLADDQVDRKGFARLVEWLLEGGASALFVNGSFGGFGFHSNARHRELAELVCREVAGRVPVFAGTSDLGLTRVKEQMDGLSDLPIDAFVLLPPLYYVHTEAEIERFCLLVADHARKPVILYDNPRLCLNRLLPAVTIRLARHPNLVGIKNSSPEEREWVELLNGDLPRDRFSLICGSEKSMSRALELGFDGVTGGFHNLVPGWAAAMVRAAKQGDFRTAHEIQQRINRAIRIFEIAGGWRGAAEVLRHMGIADRIAPAPFDHPVSDDERAAILEILNSEGVEQPDGLRAKA